MGQKTHPIGFRLIVNKNWSSNWYADKSFAAELEEDVKIRKYIQHRMPNAGLQKLSLSLSIQHAPVLSSVKVVKK